ncbi:MAG: DUF4129 domain-containing protein [Ardenticatenaceae bacterium]|nr:DUF4129 domain-containing protein [Ardenticatenaceae bacterium]
MGGTARTLAAVALALAEATWLATGLALLVAGERVWIGPGIAWFGALSVVAYALGRWVLAGSAGDPRPMRLALAAALLLLGILAVQAWAATHALRPAALTLLAGGYAWWRSWRLASQGATSSTARAAFGRGMLAWAGAAFAWQLLPAETVDLVGGLMLFVGASLLALALSALNDARQGSAGTEGPAFDRTWGTLVGGVIAVVLLIGLGLAAWLAPATIEALVAHLQPLAQLLAIVAEWIMTALVLLVTPLVYLLIWLITQLSLSEFLWQLPPPQPLQPEQNEKALPALFHIPPWVTTLVELLLVVVLVAIGLWILRLALQRYEAENEAGVLETRHIVASRDLVAAQLRSLLANVRARLAIRLREEPFLPLGPGRDPRHRIRAAYRAFLVAAAARGVTRVAGETPAAFAGRLAAQAGAPRAPLDELTAAYEPARYDTATLDPAQATTAENATAALVAWLAADEREEEGE